MADPVRDIIDGYLSNVRRRLQHLPEDERVAIVDSLKSHIHEALSSRCKSSQPTRDDVKAVLAEMDPPEAFGAEDQERAESPRRSGLGKAIFIVSAVVLAAFILSVCLRPPQQREKWGTSKFIDRVETKDLRLKVNSGELSDTEFTGETNQGVKFTATLPKSNDQDYWVNLLHKNHVVFTQRASGISDMFWSMFLSFILPMALLFGPPLLVLLIVVRIIRR